MVCQRGRALWRALPTYRRRLAARARRGNGGPALHSSLLVRLPIPRQAAWLLLAVLACHQPTDAVTGASPSALQVSLEVRTRGSTELLESPVTVRASTTPVLELRVRARNPEYYSVAVPLGGPPVQVGPNAAQSTGISFGMRIEGDPTPAGGFAALWAGSGSDPIIFAPRQSIVATFEQRLGNRGRLALRPGEYRIVGSFAQQEAEPVTLVVLP
jgi:hypothetical protein